jgi:hypothetical protein
MKTLHANHEPSIHEPNGEACTDCAAKHLEEAADGEMVLRPGHALPTKTTTRQSPGDSASDPLKIIRTWSNDDDS